MNYVEENFRKMINPWSFRHTGIYHHHSPQLDLFIILHPNEGSVLDTRLCEWLGVFPVTSDVSSLQGISSLRREPNALHLFVLSSFLDNWRWYLRHLGERFSEMVWEWQCRLSCGRLIWTEWWSTDNTTRGSRSERKLYPSKSLAKSQWLGASSSGMLQE